VLRALGAFLSKKGIHNLGLWGNLPKDRYIFSCYYYADTTSL